MAFSKYCIVEKFGGRKNLVVGKFGKFGESYVIFQSKTIQIS